MDDAGLLFYRLGGYAAKLVHVFGAVIWLGGALFIGGVAAPIVKYYSDHDHLDRRAVTLVGELERRLVGMNWMALVTVLMSGIVLLFFGSGEALNAPDTITDWGMLAKMFLILPAMVLNRLVGTTHRELATARVELETGEDLSPAMIAEWRLVMLRKANVWIAFGIILILALL